MKKLSDDVVLIKTKGYVYYAKWIATLFVLLAAAVRSVEEIPNVYDVIFSWIGTAGWLYVSLAWKDRALILLNAIMGFMLFTALLRYMI